ncbi:CTD kinase-I gamma subunit [Spathaspora passalidarum NRRL Y-27907]|uniref:CTD kinase-I gamma subunit n=1 Tax=Spathaspora passalidarum (strain NRRL Y-27907 / 11-Y1) TaxID=619300 RepID=G3ALU7_SPAPN|nr:CTD kinase-I gamma subunit [Spathaspora passalidarum NRRL Y-27907]EGW32706.1 CTD kinase-I gamma subunit [Spathaspora passalidarum NRRL Y-27907]
MDSFEAATQLSQILRNLTPSIQNLNRAARFALVNSDKEDYLLPTILDIINDSKMVLNTKSTIFQFIDVLISESFQYSLQNKYSYPYIQGLKSALPEIIQQVLPQANNSNLYNTYVCLRNISKHFKIDCSEYIDKFQCNLLTEEDISKIEGNKEFIPEKYEPSGDPLVTAWKILLEKKRQSQFERARLLKHSNPLDEIVDEDEMFNIRVKSDKSNNLLSKRQILSRMEDDREAHKRSKENLWVVNRDKNSSFITEQEFLDNYWNKYHQLNKSDHEEFLNSLSGLNKLVADSYKDKQF